MDKNVLLSLQAGLNVDFDCRLLINKKAEKKTATATRHHYSYETSAHKQNKGVQKKQTNQK